MKVMNDIASEFSIKWDSEAFEQRMSKTTVIPQVCLSLYLIFTILIELIPMVCSHWNSCDLFNCSLGPS